MNPGPEHCAEVGALLGRMHRAASDFPGQQPNLRGYEWWHATAPQLIGFLDAERRALLAEELQAQNDFIKTEVSWGLPAGPVHADLFRDNVLFEAGQLSGVIDFYFAGIDTWLFDLAVTCNDWCVNPDGSLDADRLTALVRAYHGQRPLSRNERQAWPIMLRGAALRFWLSRLDDWYRPRPALELTPKDPEHFERILRARRAGCPSLTDLVSESPCR